MLGWRARLGVMIPSVNVATEPEFYRCLPEGVTAHFTRVEFKESTPEYYESMLDDVPAGARMLSHAQVDVQMFACTSGSLYGGLGYDKRIIDQLRQHNPVPASTTSTAVIEVFQELGIKRISVITPYPKWVDELERSFFEQNGLDVASIDGLGFPGIEVGEMHPEVLYRFAKKHIRKDVDAVFISCMGARTLDMLPAMEREIGMPVLSSNQVTFWKLLKMANIPLAEIREDWGSLFRQ